MELEGLAELGGPEAAETRRHCHLALVSWALESELVL